MITALLKRLVLTVCFLWGGVQNVCADVYVIFYCTHNGYTGHTGIAIDNYDIIIREVINGNEVNYVEDTIANGYITYFDLWPGMDISGAAKAQKNCPAVYHRIPESPYSKKVVLGDVITKNQMNIVRKNANGLICIKTAAYMDVSLIAYADDIIQSKKLYNASYYNCTDFIIEILSKIYNKKISAKERILYVRFNTPNKLFIKLSRQNNTQIIKHPGKLTKGKFFRERVLYRLINKNNSNNNNDK